jgi:hypothetical protein
MFSSPLRGRRFRPQVELLERRDQPAPVVNQIQLVAVYTDCDHPFGMGYDSTRNLMWYTRGDSGDSLIHSIKPFKSFTAAERAALPNVGGILEISPAAGQTDVAGTTNPASFGSIGAHFAGLAYDAASDRLVMVGGNNNLHAFQPITGANLDTNFRPGTATDSFADGVDVDGNTVWFSPDASSIFKDGNLLISQSDSTKKIKMSDGAIADQQGGWSGVEQVGNQLFAVAVLTFNDVGRSRTIARFNPTTGELLGFDPDGDEAAARWEDLAFDGQFLYAADLRGDFNSTGPRGDIYVFGITGEGGTIGQQTDVSDKVRVFYPKRYKFKPATGQFSGFITLVNTSDAAIAGPITLVFKQLPRGVTLFSGDGTLGTKDGKPALTVPDGIGLHTPLRIFFVLKNPLKQHLSTFQIGFPVAIFSGAGTAT